MKVFVTGTDTDMGKTLVSSWLCLHTGYEYFKPIHTGDVLDRDSVTVSRLSGRYAHPENYIYKTGASPHLAAALENETIELPKLRLPEVNNLIVEGAGGVLVPINKTTLMVDLIRQFNIPTILVSRSTLGTINHTLLSLEALRARSIDILGVIVNGETNINNCNAIEFYGNTKVLAQIPILQTVSQASLLAIPLGERLNKIFEATNEPK